MEFPNPENPKLPGLCNISSVKGAWPLADGCLKLLIGLRAELFGILCDIAEGLMAMGALFAALVGRGLFREWFPLPRAAGTS